MTVTTKQKLAIASLLTGATQDQAGAAAGVKSRQVRRWLKKQEFRAELHRAESEAVEAAARTVATGAKDAVDLLRAVIEDPSATVTERTRAADRLLSHLPTLRVLGSIESRLAAAEQEQVK